jgi:hypothetical protein
MSEENTPPVVQPEFEVVTEACPPGANPAPAAEPAKAKRTKAVAKRYYVTQGLELELEDQPYAHFHVVGGSEEGFRTWEETAKFIRTLPPGRYVPISVPSKSIEIVETTTTKIKGL